MPEQWSYPDMIMQHCLGLLVYDSVMIGALEYESDVQVPTGERK